MHEHEKELEVAKDAVRAACRLCSRVREGSDVGEIEKGDRSPVTVADYASQAVVARRLTDELSGDPLVAEEGSDALRASENTGLLRRVTELVRHDADDVLGWIDLGAATPTARFWTLDPVDGTKGFLRNEQYAVALALLENGQVVLGVLGCPNLPSVGHAPSARGKGSLLWAARGEGAWQEPIEGQTPPRPVRVSRLLDLAQTRLCESVESGHTRHDISAVAAQELGLRAAAVRADSQAKYALLARGDAELYWRLPTRPGYEEKIWDHAAGSIIMEEAGGTVTDIFGKPLDFSLGRTLSANRGVLATHGPFHDEVLKVLAPHFE